MDLSYFKQFILEKESGKGIKHSFYSSSVSDIEKVDRILKIPYELRIFYSTIGYGFMFDLDEHYSIDKLLSPLEFMKINLRRDYYEYDPTLKLFDESEYNDKLIFFEINEGVYLLIEREDRNGKNGICYFDEKIADSLVEFLVRFDKEGHYFERL